MSGIWGEGGLAVVRERHFSRDADGACWELQLVLAEENGFPIQNQLCHFKHDEEDEEDETPTPSVRAAVGVEMSGNGPSTHGLTILKEQSGVTGKEEE